MREGTGPWAGSLSREDQFSGFMPRPMQGPAHSPPGLTNGDPVLLFNRYFWDLCYISAWDIKMSKSRGA